MGILILSMAIIVTPVLRHRPEQYGMQVDGPSRALAPGLSVFANFTGWLKGLKFPKHQGSTDQDYTWREAVGTLAFWLFAIAIWFGYLGMGMIQVHLFPHLEQ